MGLVGFKTGSRKSWFGMAGLASLALILAVGAPAQAAMKQAAKGAQASDIIYDPAAIRGQLANGLHYVILPNAKPEKTVLLRLYIGTGSYDETDAERGAAQALAQLALEETRHFPSDKLKSGFEAQGISFGGQSNANASMNGTTYALELKDFSAAKLDLGLRWFRDVADGLTLTPATLDHGRVGLTEQYTDSLGGPKETADALNSFIGPNLRIATRDPVATPAEIAALNLSGLQTFYAKWYAPANAHLIVVGDASASEIKAAIEAQFGSWKASRLPGRAKQNPAPDKRGLTVMTKAVPGSPTMLNICKVTRAKAAQEDSLASRTKTVQNEAWITVLNERLGRLASSANAPFASVSIGKGQGRDTASTCLQAMPVKDQWKIALEALGTELARLERHGVLTEELSQIRTDKLAEQDKAINRAKERSSQDLAYDLAQSVANRSVFTSPEEAKRVTDAVWSSLTPLNFAQGFQQGWTGSGPLISLISDKPVSPDALKSAWLDLASNGDPGAPKVPGKVVWTYDDFGPKGAVAKRELVSPANFVRVQFANGVILNFKQTDYEKGFAYIRIRFGSGQRQIEPALRSAVNLGGSLLLPGGLGQLSLDELRKANQGKQWGLSLNIGRDAFLMIGDSRLQDLDRELETMTAFLADPGFRPEANVRIPAIVDTLLKETEGPTSKALIGLSDVFGAESWMGLPSRSDLLATQMRDVSAALKGPMQTEGLEVTIVGGLAEDDAIALVARTLGALPKRRDALSIRSDFKPLSFSAGRNIQIDLPSDQDQAAILMVWPTFVLEDSRRMEVRSLALLNELVKTRLINRLKAEKLDLVRTLGSAQFANRFDQGSLVLLLDLPAKDLARVKALTDEVVSSVRSGKLGKAELDSLRKPTLDASITRRQNNGWWIGIMDGSARDPKIIEADQTMESDLRALRPEDIKAAAVNWLKSDTRIEVIAAPQPASTVAEPASSAPETPKP